MSRRSLSAVPLSQHHALASAIRSALMGLSLLAAALPLAAPAAEATQNTARKAWNIPAGTLEDALSLFAAQAGVSISFPPELVAGKRSSGLRGNHTVVEGFTQLLAGTNLVVVPQKNGGYALQVVTLVDGERALATVNVNATSSDQTAWGPANGYVARRSATGTKTDTPLIETPQSVTVVTREQIEAQGADSLDQAFEYSAGIFSLGGGANRRAATGFTVRGFNVTGSEPLYIDGSKFPINSLSGIAEPYAYERVELLKGPASILYGQAAPGGIINLVSKRPTAEPLREIQLQTGSWDRRQVSADLGGPLTTDGTLGYRITGVARDSDSMIKRIPDDRMAFSGALSWRPSERTSLTLLATRQKNETAYNYGAPFDGTAYSNPNGKVSRHLFVGEPGFNKFDNEGQTLGYLFEHRINDTFKFSQNVLWFDYESDVADIWISGATDAATRRLAARGAYTRLDTDKGYSVDNQLQAKWRSGRFEHTTLLGLDYNQHDFARVQRSGTVAALDIFTPVYGSPVTLNPGHARSTSDNQQMGIYLQDHIKFDQRWVVLLGGRWDSSDNKDGYRDTTGLAGTEKAKADAFSPRFGLLYLFDNGLSPYISYTESFQPAFGSDYFKKAFEPTTGQQFEAGLKFEPVGRNAALTVSVYELTQQNVLTGDIEHSCTPPAPLTPVPDCGSFSKQTGEIRSRGVEVEGRASLNDNLDLVAAYAYTDAEITKSNGADLGRTPTSVPRDMASLWADYRFRAGALGGLSLGGGARYVGNSFNNDNAIKVPAYTVYDAAIRYDIANWRLALNLKNLTDKEYLAACTFSCFYGDERNFTLTARYSW